MIILRGIKMLLFIKKKHLLAAVISIAVLALIGISWSLNLPYEEPVSEPVNATSQSLNEKQKELAEAIRNYYTGNGSFEEAYDIYTQIEDFEKIIEEEKNQK